MCGIIGSIGPAKLNLDLICHRGPDDRGIYSDEYISLGHTRLSILDLSSHGHQPAENSEVVLTYNGEIYNHLQFSKNETCDTISLLNFITSQGVEFDPGKLDGMFAFASYFKNPKKLVLCRDFAGIKPLFITFSEDKKKMAFCSEIKGFFGIDWFVPIPNPTKFVQEEFLQYGYSCQRRVDFQSGKKTSSITLRPTLLKNVFAIPPASKMVIDIATFEMSQVKFSVSVQGERNSLQQEVKAQSMSNVEVGVQMSGGIDSTLVSYYYAKNVGKVHGFYVSVPGAENEDHWVNIAANKIKSESQFNLHAVKLTKEELLRAFKKATWYHDEPILRHPNACAIYLLCEYVKKNTAVKVLLTGEGADELYGGYSWQDGTNSLSYGNDRSAFVLSSCHIPIFVSTPGQSVLEKQLRYDFEVYLPPILLRQDKMSMAHSIESRVPFLSNSAFLQGFPKQAGKVELKKLSASIFGKEFAYRPKCGFGIPLDWLEDTKINMRLIDWMKVRVTAATTLQRFYLNSLALWSLYYIHNKGKVTL